jgi:arylformamidase
MAFRGMTAEQLEKQFNPRAAVPEHGPLIAWRMRRSEETRRKLRCELELRYGPNPLETLDVFPGAPGGPVQLYIHGGYWRANDKADASAIAEPLVAKGATVVLINYDLCPKATVGQIVEEVRRAVAWTYRNIRRYGGDPDRLFISGNSAGAHLCAMTLAHDWLGEGGEGLPADVIKGAAPITGIYDLEPVLHITVNADVRLTPAEAKRLSPMTQPPLRKLPLLVAVGGAETPEWIRQSKDYAAMCRAHGIDAEYLECPGENHFTMTNVLADPEHMLTRAIVRQMGL